MRLSELITTLRQKIEADGDLEGYIIMPEKITNRKEARLLLEYTIKQMETRSCSWCGGDPTEECSLCCDGEIEGDVLISWDTIKTVYHNATALQIKPTITP